MLAEALTDRVEPRPLGAMRGGGLLLWFTEPASQVPCRQNALEMTSKVWNDVSHKSKGSCILSAICQLLVILVAAGTPADCKKLLMGY